MTLLIITAALRVEQSTFAQYQQAESLYKPKPSYLKIIMLTETII